MLKKHFLSYLLDFWFEFFPIYFHYFLSSPYFLYLCFEFSTVINFTIFAYCTTPIYYFPFHWQYFLCISLFIIVFIYWPLLLFIYLYILKISFWFAINLFDYFVTFHFSALKDIAGLSMQKCSRLVKLWIFSWKISPPVKTSN